MNKVIIKLVIKIIIIYINIIYENDLKLLLLSDGNTYST